MASALQTSGVMHPKHVSALVVIALVQGLTGCSSTEDDERNADDRLGEGAATANAEPQGNKTDELMHLATPPCSSGDYGVVESCHNRLLPPPPSISRVLSAADQGRPSASDTHDHGAIAGIDGDAYLRASPGVPTVLPNRRSTSDDGRLLVGATYESVSYGKSAKLYLPQIDVFLPERVGADVRASALTGAQAKSVRRLRTFLHPVMYQNPYDTGMSYTGLDAPKLASVASFHMDLCEDASPEPRFCQAPRTSAAGSDLLAGDCYDETLLLSLENGDNLAKWELRSVPLTIFVERGKNQGLSTDAELTGTNAPKVVAFPRTNGSLMPAVSQVAALSQLGESQSWKTLVDACTGSAPPFYCSYIANQKRSTKIRVHRKDDWKLFADPYAEIPGGEANSQASFTTPFFEESTTSDGRLMVFNSGGLYYSYNALGRCRADGWKQFEPVSRIPVDPQIYQNYDIGRSQRKDGAPVPLRDTYGKEVEPGALLDGSYPWVDRAGKNILFTFTSAARDGIFAKSAEALPGGGNHFVTSHKNYLNPDKDPGKGFAALGAWTHGKIVMLDTSGVPTDFGGVPSSNGRFKTFELQLYQGPTTKVRPRGLRIFNSLENRLNYFSALSPTLPFDVSWLFSGDTQRNGEIAFDDYVRTDAWLIAHMNAAQMEVEVGGPNDRKLAVPADGFWPDHPENSVREGASADFRFSFSPHLQNAATGAGGGTGLPSHMLLLGGARVEPVANGVLGKALFLDGINDHAKTQGHGATQPGNWNVNVWVDVRNDDRADARTLFYFPDRSWVALALDKIVFRSSRSAAPLQTLDISGLALPASKFFHLSLLLSTETIGGARTRQVRVFVNGTQVGLAALTFATSAAGDGFDMDGSAGFTLGDPGPIFKAPQETAARRPIRAWLDELKIFKTAPGASAAFLQEGLCNQALGSLIEVRDTDTDPRISPLVTRATMHRVWGGPAQKGRALVCEQLALTDFSGASEMPDQNGKTICAANVHRSLDALGQERCMRRKSLSIHDKALVPSAPRPDFSQVAFCQTCHFANANLMGFRPTALFYTPSVVRADDSRRQPLDWPRRLHGCVPQLGALTTPGGAACTNAPATSMDVVFDLAPKLAPAL